MVEYYYSTIIKYNERTKRFFIPVHSSKDISHNNPILIPLNAGTKKLLVLRHSYLTYAAGETTDYKTVQGISGHADLNTLLNTYAHPQTEKVRQLADNMSRILA